MNDGSDAGCSQAFPVTDNLTTTTTTTRTVDVIDDITIPEIIICTTSFQCYSFESLQRRENDAYLLRMTYYCKDSEDLTPRIILKLSHQVPAPDRGGV